MLKKRKILKSSKGYNITPKEAREVIEKVC